MKVTVKSVKIIKTCNLYLCALLTGMCMAITGPTLLDLQNTVGTDTQHIAFVYTARSAGYLFGSIFGGILFDMTNKKQLIFTLFNFVCAASTFAIPWSRVIGALTGFMTVNGFTMGLLDTGTNVCILYLWGKESGPYYQALHFVYGVGGLISPLIAAPFLNNHETERVTDNFTYHYNETILETLVQTNNSFFNDPLPPITYAYTIIGGVGILVTVLFLVMSIASPVDDNGQKEEDSQTRASPLGFVILIVSLNFFLLFVDTGTEIGFAQMVATYSVKGPLQLTKTVGSYITSTFWGSFTVFRFISVFLALKLSNRSMVIFDVIITSLGAAVLQCLAPDNEWALWLASALLGAGVASLFPSAIAWVDQYITVTNKMVSLFAVGAAFGEMVVPYTISYFINEMPAVLIYVVIASCVLSAAIVIVMFIVLRNRLEKYLTDEEISTRKRTENSNEERF